MPVKILIVFDLKKKCFQYLCFVVVAMKQEGKYVRPV